MRSDSSVWFGIRVFFPLIAMALFFACSPSREYQKQRLTKEMVQGYKLDNTKLKDAQVFLEKALVLETEITDRKSSISRHKAELTSVTTDEKITFPANLPGKIIRTNWCLFRSAPWLVVSFENKTNKYILTFAPAANGDYCLKFDQDQAGDYIQLQDKNKKLRYACIQGYQNNGLIIEIHEEKSTPKKPHTVKGNRFEDEKGLIVRP